MFIYKAGVIGAGRMGAEIAQVISFSGLPVIMIDQTEEALSKGLETVKKIYASRVEKGKMTETEAAQKIMLVTTSTDFEELADADIVVEAVYEDMEVKQKLLKTVSSYLPQGAIIASNSSALSISEMGAVALHPERVIGMHFFNPAHVMKLVEVIPSLATSQEVVDDTVAFAESLRKIPIRVNECAGFLVNRLLMPYLNEATIMLHEGTGSIREIDAAVVEFGMPMGPFTLMDMIGIDIGEKVAAILADAYGPRMAPAPLFAEMIKAGRLGQKSGAGFYSYNDGEEFSFTIKPPKKDCSITGSALITRLLLPMVNEAVICYQESVSSPTEIDIGTVAGLGFPQDRGGPLHWADSLGLDNMLEMMQRLTRDHGERFRPAPMIKRMVSAGFTGSGSGRGFFDYNL